MKHTARELHYDDISVGDDASFSVIIDEKMVSDFAALSEDTNPLHMDVDYASQTQFGGRVAHGMIIGALFSRLVGMYLPGKYSLYLSQSMRFHEPIAFGTEISVRGEVTHKSDAAKTVNIATTAHDAASNKLLVNGEALVRLLQ